MVVSNVRKETMMNERNGDDNKRNDDEWDGDERKETVMSEWNGDGRKRNSDKRNNGSDECEAVISVKW